MSDGDGDDTELDPRIQVELEKLNTTTDEINRLEIEYDEANITFRMLLNESTRRLKNLSKKLNTSIDKARSYYELLEEAKKAQQECQEAAAIYKKAYGIHSAAKETVALAEQRFLVHQHEWQFDNAWQDMLNHATIKVMEAEHQKAESEREHQRKATLFKEIEERLKQLEEKNHKFIIKSRPYFDEKALCQEQLNTQKSRIEKLKHEIIKAKTLYSNTLKTLEQISNEIHMKRKGIKNDRDLLRGPREPGVGAELNAAFEEVPLSKQFMSLPDINLELAKTCPSGEPFASNVTSAAVSEIDEEEEVDEIGDKLENLEMRPVEGKSESVFVSEYHLGTFLDVPK